ncbi:MAG TPA: ATP-binding cassette domain-containing protein, partial [Thermoanaerobaculia bacterium]
MPLLEAKNVTIRFGGLTAVSDFNLTLEPHELVGLIGPNGAGKTSLVGLLSGTIRPDAGQISLFGRDITREGLAFRVKQGLVRTFQVSSLFAKLTVLENIFLAVSENAGASSDMWQAAGRRRALIERAEGIMER